MTLPDTNSNAKLCKILIGLEGDIRQFRQSLEAYERTNSVKSRLGNQSEESSAASHRIESLTGELCTFFPEARVLSTLKASNADCLKDMTVKFVSLRESLEEAKRIR